VGEGDVTQALLISALGRGESSALCPEKEPLISVVLETGWAVKLVCRLLRRDKSLVLAGNLTMIRLLSIL
jgi:hypothetical protein